MTIKTQRAWRRCDPESSSGLLFASQKSESLQGDDAASGGAGSNLLTCGQLSKDLDSPIYNLQYTICLLIAVEENPP